MIVRENILKEAKNNESIKDILKPKSEEDIKKLTLENNFALNILNSNYKEVKNILDNTNIDPSEYNNVYLSLAIFKNNDNIIKLLLNDTRVISKIK